MRLNFSLFLRRATLRAYDVLSLGVCALVFSLAYPSFAWAYVDPSVMTYTIQALAGVAVALSAVAGVAMRRTRKVLMRALNIDENAGKEIEPCVHRLDSDGSPIISEHEKQASAPDCAKRGKGAHKGSTAGGAASDAAGAAASERVDARKRKGDKPKWLRRLVLSFIVVLFCGFTLGIVAPFEIVAGNAGSLAFDLTDVWFIVASAVGVCVVVLTLVISFVPGKAFSHVLVLVFCGGLCCYLQAMFLNTGLPSANGDTVDFWGDHTTMMIVSAVVWVLVLLVPTIVTAFNRARSQVIVAALSICLVLVQAVGVASLFAPSSEQKATGPGAAQVTEDGLFEVSDKSNVVVFILDRFETGFFDSLHAEYPDMLDGFDGFTYYRDSTGTMLPTLNAIPNLLTGEEPHEGEDYLTFQKERYSRSSFLEDINAQGYSVGLYSDTMELQYMSNDEMRAEVASQTINIHSTDTANINAKGVLKALAKCALYRDMPWVLKARFWFYTDEVNAKAVQWANDGDPENTPYTIDDSRYYDRLQQYGLSTEKSNTNGAFRFIHLTGAHTPYTINENAEYVGVDAVTRTQQSLGALHIVKSYIEHLKELGVYDNTTIIVMADHGDWESSLEAPTFAISPLFMMKPAGATGDAQVSDVPVSHEDFQATVLEAMGASVETYESYGTPVDQLSGEERTRNAYMITSDGHNVIDVLHYTVDGYALDFSNWKNTGESWHVNNPG